MGFCYTVVDIGSLELNNTEAGPMDPKISCSLYFKWSQHFIEHTVEPIIKEQEIVDLLLLRQMLKPISEGKDIDVVCVCGSFVPLPVTRWCIMAPWQGMAEEAAHLIAAGKQRSRRELGFNIPPTACCCRPDSFCLDFNVSPPPNSAMHWGPSL